ncbi:MAG: hypothetical protein ACUVS2_10385 [Candidatus Flexifilum sp.]|jgi:hypothetical protein
MSRQHALSFSDDGRYLFHIRPTAVRIWREQQFVRQHPGRFVGHARDGRTFLTENWETKVISAWDSDSGAPIDRSAIAPDSYSVKQRTLIRQERLTLILHDALVDAPPRRITLDAHEHACIDTWDLSADGSLLAIAFWFDMHGHDAAWGNCYRLTGGDRIEHVFEFEVARFADTYIQFCDPHRLLVISDSPSQRSVLNTSTGHRVKRFQYELGKGGDFLCFSPVDANVAALHYNRDRWRLYNGSHARDIDEPALAAAFHPSGRQVVTAMETNALHVHTV